MRFRILITSLSLAALGTCASAQDAQSMLGGAGNALTLKPDGLTSNFKAVQIKTTGGGGNGLLDMIMSPMMMMMGALGGMSGGAKDDGPPFALMTALDLSWTTGQMQTFFGQSYLVTYKLDFDMSKLAGAARDLSGLDLRLQFIRTDMIASFTPRPDISPAQFIKMLKAPPAPPAAAEPATPPSEGDSGGGTH